MNPMVNRMTPSGAESRKLAISGGRSPGLSLICIPPTLMKVGG